LGEKKQAPQGQQESEARKKQKRMGKAVVSNPTKRQRPMGQVLSSFLEIASSRWQALACPSQSPFTKPFFNALSESALANHTKEFSLIKPSFPKQRFPDYPNGFGKRLPKRFQKRLFSLTDD